MKKTTAAALVAFFLVPGIAVAQNGPPENPGQSEEAPGQSVREFVQEPDAGRERGEAQPGDAISGAAQEQDLEQLNEEDCPPGSSPTQYGDCV